MFLSVLLRIALFVGDTTNLSGNIIPVNPLRLLIGTDTRADSLLLGCFTGVLLSSNRLPAKNWMPKMLKLLSIIAGIGLLALGLCWEKSPWMICGGWFLASLFGMVTIICAVSSIGSPINLILENSALKFIGRISYGLYVWHYPILIALQQHHLPWRNLVYLVVVIPVVLLSYYSIEKPCLRLKIRFSIAQNGYGSRNVGLKS